MVLCNMAIASTLTILKKAESVDPAHQARVCLISICSSCALRACQARDKHTAAYDSNPANYNKRYCCFFLDDFIPATSGTMT